jgi:tripeptide aminopeptidase
MTILDEQRNDPALEAIVSLPATRQAFDWIGASADRFVDDLIALSQIPAPTFEEAQRAAYVAAAMEKLGIEKVHFDDVGNVLGVLAGDRPGPAIAFMAHLDTVFPAGTNVGVRRDGGRLYGPGIGDNAAGLAGLLHMVQALRFADLQPSRPVWIVASTGEEGLGDLRGARAAVESLRERVSDFIAIEGALLGRVTHEAVGSLRWRVRFSGPGGHSWHDFGRPNAVTAAGRAIAELTKISVPSKPRTTFNVGRIEGGIGVNVIPSEATMLLDMRSTDPAALSRLVAEADRTLRATAAQESVEIEIEIVGDRPAGSIPREHRLAELAASVLRNLRIEPRYEAASTDANIPLSLGISAVTVGISHGGGIHTEAEWLDIAPCTAGIRQLLLLALALCRVEI